MNQTDIPEGGTPAAEFRSLVTAFAGSNSDYYAAHFERIGDSRGFALSINPAACLLGPIWFGARSLWAAFWAFFTLETLAVVLIGTGLLGDLGSASMQRAERLLAQATERRIAAEQAQTAGDPLAESMLRSAEAIARAAERATAEAAEARAGASALVAKGAALLLFLRLTGGILANPLLAFRFRRWRANPAMNSGLDWWRSCATATLAMSAYALAVYRFAYSDAPGELARFPASEGLRKDLARAIDRAVEWCAASFGFLFDAVTRGINAVLNLMEIALVVTPWPIVMASILVIAWQVSGRRVAIFSAAALAYLGILGFWEKSMATIALLGTAAFLSIAIGIPLGIWCGRNSRIYAVVRPVLDFMQTMPAFVYLIPVIAFFGIGKPPGIIATLIFGMPPVVRLTALGLSGVPGTVREAAIAFGANSRFLLFKVDLPLAMPSIMAGVNQTLLMCLSMVVIASLIGAKGLGEDVLAALQYAAVGEGVLAGFAILMCAMVLDRIVQGRS